MNLDTAFWDALVSYANKRHISPEWFLRIFYLESGLDPSSDNGSFVGLNQLSKQYLSNRRIDPSDYKHWPASRQLTEVVGPWYADTIDSYLGKGKVPRSIGVLYALNLAPGYVKERGDNADTVLYQSPDNRYELNKGLDANKDGTITIGDLDDFLTKKALEAPYKTARAELAKHEKGILNVDWNMPVLKYAPVAIAVGLFVAVIAFVRGSK